ncbi:hypothetical protein WMY93_021073 [Mugilogobius chulae]|uniref:Retrotransposon gag domain-containing protein n=1 Tax=Mugilogobius chulae TaxID=88201 RepID=A0AAW0N9N5_9GOBI
MFGGSRGYGGTMDEDEYKYKPSWPEEVCNVKVDLPPPFCGDGRKLFATWIKQFEAAVRAQIRGATGRSYVATLAAVLPTRLDGAAFLLWDSLPSSVQCDFELVKEKLNEAFGQKQFLLYFQTCVSARPRLANESLELYAADISRLVAEAFPDYDAAAQNGEKFRRFLAGLDPGLRAKCHEQGATDLEEALVVAGRCERARLALGVETQTGPYSQPAPATVASLSSAEESGLGAESTAGKLLSAVERLSARMDKLQMDMVNLREQRDDYGPRVNQRFPCTCDCGGVGCRATRDHRGGYGGGGRSPQNGRRSSGEWLSQTGPDRAAVSDSPSPRRGGRGSQRGRFFEGQEQRRGVRFFFTSSTVTLSFPTWTEPGKLPVTGGEARPSVLPSQGHAGHSSAGVDASVTDCCAVGESKCTSYIRGSIEGVDVAILIDSGSNVSLINEEFKMSVPALRKRVLSSDYVLAHTVNGQLLDTLGSMTVSMCLGGKYVEQKVHVVRGANQKVLLGFDFLTEFHAVLDVSHSLLRLRDVDIPLLHANDLIPRCCNITMSADVTIPPYSEMVVPVHVVAPRPTKSHINSYVGYLEPENRDHTELVVARTVAPVKDGLTVARLLNPTDHELKMHSGSHLGVLYHVDESDIFEPTDCIDSDQLTTLPDLADCSLTDDQRQQLSALLEKHREDELTGLPQTSEGKWTGRYSSS